MLYRNFIEAVLNEAAQIARESYGKVSGTVKVGDNNQILTATDLQIGQMIIGEIKKQFPDHSIIDEEAGSIRGTSRFTWVVDPIDGTSNFSQGIPLYGTMLGLLEEGVPVAGGVVLPNFNELYLAERGSGAYCNGNQIGVSKEEMLKNALVGYGIDGHQEDPTLTRAECELLSEIVLNIRNLRTSNSAFDTAMVAKGCYGAVLNRTSKIWDNVAWHVIIEEAGGVYSDFFGNPIDYSDPLSKADDNFTCLAAAPILHAQLCRLIHNKA